MFRAASIYTGVFNRWLMVLPGINSTVLRFFVMQLQFCRAIDIVLAMQGNASAGERARNTGAQANELIEAALSYIARENVLPEHPPSGN